MFYRNFTFTVLSGDFIGVLEELLKNERSPNLLYIFLLDIFITSPQSSPDNTSKFSKKT